MLNLFAGLLIGAVTFTLLMHNFPASVPVLDPWRTGMLAIAGALAVFWMINRGAVLLLRRARGSDRIHTAVYDLAVDDMRMRGGNWRGAADRAPDEQRRQLCLDLALLHEQIADELAAYARLQKTREETEDDNNDENERGN